MDLLSCPSNTGSLRLVQWPLFLLSSKVQVKPDNFTLKRYDWPISVTYPDVISCSVLCYRFCWLLIWPWIVKMHKKIFGIEYVGMNTWHMRLKNATTVLKNSYIRLLTVKGDSGMNFFWSTIIFWQFLLFPFYFYAPHPTPKKREKRKCLEFNHFFSHLLDGRVERIYREINSSILEGSLVITLFLKKLPVVLQKFTALTGLLVHVNLLHHFSKLSVSDESTYMHHFNCVQVLWWYL